MKSLIKPLIVIVVLAAVIFAGISFANPGGKGKKEEVKYETAKASTGDVRSSVSATGIIQPPRTIDVKSDVAGRVMTLLVDLGYHVKKGQLIATIDPTDTEAQYQQASADYLSAQQKEAQSKVALDEQKLTVEAKIASAQRALENAKAKLAQSLATRDAQPKLTEYSISQAQASLTSAQKSVQQSMHNKAQLEESLHSLREVTIPLNVETVQSNVQQAKANLLTAQRELKRQRQLLAQGYVAQGDVEQAYSREKTNEATVRTAEQRLNTLKRENELSIRELEARVQQAQSQIETDQAHVKEAQAGLDLAKQNSFQVDVRKQEYAAAAAAVEQAKADLRAAQATREEIKLKQKDIETAKQQVRKTSASEHQASINLGYTKVLAPSDGVVITKNVEAGTVVPSSKSSIGSTNALVQLGDTRTEWVVCSVDETDIGQVSVGQKVSIKVDAYPSMLVDGKVIRIDPQAKIEQSVTTIPVTVQIDQPDPRFKPGMNATCEFIVDEVTSVITVPNEAVKEKDGSYFVQVVKGRDKAGNVIPSKLKETEVEVGLAGPDTTEIRSGLEDGDEVVTKIVEPEKPTTNNPFGSPFGGPPRGGGKGGGGGGGKGR